jgi:hypothetical protein
MSGRLVGEVVEWLLTPAAQSLTSAERAVLLVIAERANDETREMWRYRADAISLDERIAIAVGTPKGLQKVLWRLADRGLEVRIQIAWGKDARPVFAARGRAMRFRLPEFPASVTLPEREDRPLLPDVPVDNSGPEPVDNPSVQAEKGRRPSGQSGESPDERLPNSPERADRRLPLSTYKEDPYKTSPYAPGVPAVRTDVEGAPPERREPSAKDQVFRQPPILLAVSGPTDDEYADARDALGRLPDLGQAALAAARSDLGADAPLVHLVIHAAALSRRTA